jgi:ABC-type multidrug transport system ATPase subunit
MLWDVVKRAKARTGIVLTTHSMEEAEVGKRRQTWHRQ